jgi:predicted ATP-binding protein involved in virulence
MIALVADLAQRLARLNVADDLDCVTVCQDVPGIVLIDEVDMHLHPEWQQVILPTLQATFSRVQFIVTTHSPQVLSTVPRECIRILSQQDGKWYATMPDQSPLGRSSADALARVQGVDPRPPLPIQDEIARYEQLVRAGHENDAQAIAVKRQLDGAGVEIPEADLATWRFLASRRGGAARG